MSNNTSYNLKILGLVGVVTVIVLAIIVSMLFDFQADSKEAEPSSTIETATYQEQIGETSANNNEGGAPANGIDVDGTTIVSPTVELIITFIAVGVPIFIATIALAKWYSAKPSKIVEDSGAVPKNYTSPAAKNHWAVIGLCLSICSPVFFVVLAPAGLVCSIIGLKKSKQLNGIGQGLALAGIITALAVAMFSIFLILAFKDAFK